MNPEKLSLIFAKDRSKKLNCCLQQFLFGALRVNIIIIAKRTIAGSVAVACF